MCATECSKCGSTDLDTNDSTAELFCRACGNIMEQSQMVSNLSFVATGSGAKTTSGHKVGLSVGLNAAIGTGSGASREGVLVRGFAGIQHVADSLRLSNQLIEGAQRMYALAVNSRLTIGRKRERIAAACLYTMCRRDRRPFLLIDFSDALEIPVKKLGQCFMNLCRGLHIKELPSVDPSLFMDRFTQQIPMITEKGAHRDVAHSAIKVVQSMNRDWLCTGRRPHGIIGAALVIACRIHGFPINPQDVAHMCRISPKTIIARLNEFRTTSLALIKADDFETVEIEDLPQQATPPALQRHQRLEALRLAGVSPRRQAIKSLYERALDCMEDEKPCLSACIDRWGQHMLENNDAEGAYEIEFKAMEALEKGPQGSDAEDEDMTAGGFDSLFDTNLDDMMDGSGGDTDAGNLFSLGQEYDEDMNELSPHEPSGNTETLALTNNNTADDDDLWGGLLSGGDKGQDDDLFGSQPDWGDANDMWGEAEGDSGTTSVVEVTINVDDVESDIEDVDENEFQCMILNAQEKRAKTLLWDELTKETLPALYRRRYDRQMREETRSENERERNRLPITDTEQFFGGLGAGDKDMYQNLFV